jgi:hypothetical protein
MLSLFIQAKSIERLAMFSVSAHIAKQRKRGDSNV